MDLDDKQGTQLDGEALWQLKTSRMGFSIERKPCAQRHVWCWLLVDFLWYCSSSPNNYNVRVANHGGSPKKVVENGGVLMSTAASREFNNEIDEIKPQSLDELLKLIM